MPRAGTCDSRPSISRRALAAFVFYAADGLGVFAGQLGRPGDRVLDEADLIDQPVRQRLLGGENLAGRDSSQARPGRL